MRLLNVVGLYFVAHWISGV